nr:MAG TPA: hypothetical protein [Caudoviricetes sp.]
MKEFICQSSIKLYLLSCYKLYAFKKAIKSMILF